MKKTILFSILYLSFFSKALSQCAMCKAVVENGDAKMAEGINNGILFLMAFPYILIGTLFYFLYKYKMKNKN